jgi:hypothetical protein
MNRAIPLFSLALLFSSFELSAQTLREIEFSVYGQYPVKQVEYTPVSDAAVAAGASAENPVIIKTHSLTRTGPHAFKGGNQISFYQATTDKKRVAAVTLTDASDKWLLIFVKNPHYKEDPTRHLKYLIYPFDDSRRNLPSNGLVFLNISGKQLDGLLEDKRVTLNAGQSSSYRIQESLPVNLWARGFDGKKLLPSLIKTYRFKPDHRYLMIFFPPVLRGSADLDVRFLSEATE